MNTKNVNSPEFENQLTTMEANSILTRIADFHHGPNVLLLLLLLLLLLEDKEEDKEEEGEEEEEEEEEELVTGTLMIYSSHSLNWDQDFKHITYVARELKYSISNLHVLTEHAPSMSSASVVTGTDLVLWGLAIQIQILWVIQKSCKI